MNSTENSQNDASTTTTTTTSEATQITVRVGQLPGKIRTLDAPAEGTTVGTLLAQAGLSATGHEIRVDNQLANLNTPVRNNQTVLLIRPVKGNAEGDMITVRVGQLPGKIRTIDAPADGCTVATLLNTAELVATGHEIRVDNQLATLDTPVRNNQTVLLIRPVKGNAEGDMITVRVGQLPGKIRTIDAPADGCTVASLLNTAELVATGHEIRVDNQLATLDTPVRNNQTVLLIRPVKGN